MIIIAKHDKAFIYRDFSKFTQPDVNILYFSMKNKGLF